MNTSTIVDAVDIVVDIDISVKMMDFYVSAGEAARMLGVSLPTLYTYVSRKGIRSQKVPGSRERRYWRPDIERLRNRERPEPDSLPQRATDITLLTPEGHFYRGESALRLADSHTLEQVASLLWQIDPDAIFGDGLPAAPAGLGQMSALLANATSTDKAIALLPLLEQANPSAYDLSHAGMCRTGADVLRWYAAILTDQDRPASVPLHMQVAQHLGVDDEAADLIRRLLVLCADHGFRAGAYAVRAVASTGVSPYRSLVAGFAITNGRRSQFGRMETIRRMLVEIRESHDPRAVILGRLQAGEALPGFETLAPYDRAGDPRAVQLWEHLGRVFGRNAEFDKAAVAIDFAETHTGVKPSFALVNTLFANLIGLPGGKALYILGRCAGWVAHSIEQYEAGPMEPPVSYRGALPPALQAAG